MSRSPQLKGTEKKVSKPAKRRKSWKDKLADDKDLPKVVQIPPDGIKRWGGETLAIPAPREVDALMQRVPRGQVITTTELRAAVAKRHRAEVGCPLTTGIFSWIAAHAAEEALAAGVPESKITPYWRTLKAHGELNPKFPGGIPAIRAHLQAEGHQIVQRGKRYFVQGYDRVLWPGARARG